MRSVGCGHSTFKPNELRMALANKRATANAIDPCMPLKKRLDHVARTKSPHTTTPRMPPVCRAELSTSEAIQRSSQGGQFDRLFSRV